MTRRDPYQTAVRWTFAVGALWFFVRPAFADDGPPMDGPYDYDAVCVHYTCAAVCNGRADLGDCYRACQRGMEKDCSPCCEEPATDPKPAPPGRPRPTP